MRDASGDQGGYHVKKVHNYLILKDWLGDLDSNQDSQIQSLESYQLDDLPAAKKKTNRSAFPRIGTAAILYSNLIGFPRAVNRSRPCTLRHCPCDKLGPSFI